MFRLFWLHWLRKQVNNQLWVYAFIDITFNVWKENKIR